MVYALVTDFVTKYQEIEAAELSSLGSGYLSHDRTAITEALTDASAEIDIILGVRFLVPITSPNRYLTHACCEIARKNLYPIGVETINIRYAQVIKQLTDIANGKAALGSPAEPSTPPTSVLKPSMLIGERRAVVPDFNHDLDRGKWRFR
jgi:phage gp36-like protein